MITKENYEAYFLDYIEGNLSQNDIDMLLQFLEQHPSLKDELEFYDEVSLIPTSDTIDKSVLHKVDFTTDAIDVHNFEEFAIAHLEGELSSKKSEELQRFTAKNINAENDLKLITFTTLKADKSIVYPNKGELKKTVSLRPLYYRIAGIAAILLLFFYFLSPINFTSDEKFVATNRKTGVTNNSNIDNTNSTKNNIGDIKTPTQQESEKVAVNINNEKNLNLNNASETSSVANNDTGDISQKHIEKSQHSTFSIEKINLVETKQIALSNTDINRKVSGFVPVKVTGNYYETDANIENQSNEHKWLSPKEFLTSLFKKEVLKSDDDGMELNPEDFNNALASATNQKVSFQKSANNDRYLSINTKNFSFEKKISK